MGGYLLKRLALMVPVAIGITLAVFLLLRLIPGDPARVILGIHATPELLRVVHAKLGLDRSLGVQYMFYVRNLLLGDLGQSYFYGEPIGRLVLTRAVPTLLLMAYSTVVSLLIAIPAGLLSATRRDRAADHLVRVVAVVGVGLPSYWTGFVLILAFAVLLPIFPVGGYGDTWPQRAIGLFLPSLTIALNIAPLVLRALRGSLTEALGAGFIDTARAKGLPARAVLMRHALRVAILPALTVLGLNIGFLVGNTVIVENVFAIPGLGQLLIASIGTRDYPTIQAVTLLFGVIVVLIYLLTDLLQLLLDPRARHAQFA
jgi:peptide/nickel transport system permease protein